MRGTQRRSTLALSSLLVAAMSFAVVSCNDDSSSGGSDGSDATDASAELTGDPVKIGVLYVVDEASGTDNSKVEMAINAAIDAKQADGGLDGRPIELEVCTFGLNDPNGATDCANQFAADESIIATVGNQHGEGDTVDPILEQAGLVAIGNGAIAFEDFTNPISFPVSPGALAVGGAGTLLVDETGIDDIALGLIDLEGAEQTTVLMNEALTTRGTEVAGEVTLPTAKQDLSSEAQQLADEGSGNVIATLPDGFARYITSASSIGVLDEVTVSTVDSIMTPDVVESLGELAEGVYVATGGLGSDGSDAPGVQRYNEEIEQYGDPSESDGLTKNAWLATQVFFAAAESAKTLDRQGILRSMNNLVYDSEGMAPVLDFTKESNLLGGIVTRAFNQSVQYAQVQDGEIVPLSDDFVEIYTAP